MEFLVDYKIDLFDFTTLQRTSKQIKAGHTVFIKKTKTKKKAVHVAVTINCAYFYAMILAAPALLVHTGIHSQLHLHWRYDPSDQNSFPKSYIDNAGEVP